MEEGFLALRRQRQRATKGQQEFGTKAEVKNVNSFRFIREAFAYEIERQSELLQSGGRVVQETRLYNPAEGKTYSMRSKEEAHDYRYFPEPDLLPLIVNQNWQAEIRRDLSGTAGSAPRPHGHGLRHNRAGCGRAYLFRSLADQFEEAAKASKNPKRVANLVQSELMGRLKARNLAIAQSPISMKGVALSADLAETGAISSKMLKDLYDLAFERGEDFAAVYEKEKPQQITDSPAIEKMIDEVIAADPKQLEQYRAGKKTVTGFFVGQVMKLSKGQANPKLVNEILERKLTKTLTNSVGRGPNCQLCQEGKLGVSEQKCGAGTPARILSSRGTYTLRQRKRRVPGHRFSGAARRNTIKFVMPLVTRLAQTLTAASISRLPTSEPNLRFNSSPPPYPPSVPSDAITRWHGTTIAIGLS